MTTAETDLTETTIDLGDRVATEPEPGGPSASTKRRSPSSYLAARGMNPWLARVLFVAFVVLVFSVPDLLGDPTRTRQWAEYLCYAMIAIGIDVAWGYGGMLVLGQGVFFGLGAYAMGMYLTLEQTAPGQLPQFMGLYSDYKTLPWLWKPFEHLWFAGAAAVIVPMIVAGLLGLLVFKRRVRGPYFAILTQATALVFWLLLVGQLKLTAGTNGLTNFTTIFGRNKYQPGTNRFLYTITAIGLIVVLLIGLQVVRSRFGRLLVATRDGEDRVRFLGYDPAIIKTVAFAIAAGMAGLAGALSAPIIGIVAPNQFTVIPSIIMVCWVAVGGRGTIWGALLGAVLVSWGKTNFSETWPEQWQYVQGGLFIVVVAFIPGGILGGLKLARDGLPGRLRRRPAGPTESMGAANAADAADAVGAPVAGATS